jgi:hypothetical protein
LVSIGINKVMVTGDNDFMEYKVSLASPYLDDVRSNVDEGPVRVGSARSVGSLQIFAGGVSVKRCSWLSFGVGDFDLFLRCVLRQDPISSTLYFGDDGLQACVAWGVAPADVLSAVAKSRCKE